jgi:tetratricopeptide (TPR) repeat protein
MRVTIVWVLIFVLIQIKVYSQTEKKQVDSLVALLTQNDRIDQVSVFRSLAIALEHIDETLALNYIEQVEPLALNSGDSLKIVIARRIKGQILRRLDRFAESITIHNQALGIATRNHFDIESANINTNIGNTYTLLSAYDKALKCHHGALFMYEKLDKPDGVAISFNNIGLVHYKIKLR